MNKILYLLLFILFITFNVLADEGLVIDQIKSSDLDKTSLNYFEVDIYRTLSNILEMDVERSRDSSSEDYRYILESEVGTDKDSYVYKYLFYDRLNSDLKYDGTISESSLNDITDSFASVVKKVKSLLRKPPVLSEVIDSQIVIEADIAGADIFVSGKYIGESPVIVQETIGKEIVIEARTETLKQSFRYVVEDVKLKVLSIELKPIMGSFLLRGDVLGRTLYIDNEPYLIEKTALFQDIPVGKISLSIESEWGVWEDTVYIEEDILKEINVDYSPISRINIEVLPELNISVCDIAGNPFLDLSESETLILEPGEYKLTTTREGYISVTETLALNTGVLHNYKTPVLTPLKVEPIAIDTEYENLLISEHNSRIDKVQTFSFWSGVGTGALLLCGLVGEMVVYDQYRSADISSDAVQYRETSQMIRNVNIAFLSTSIISWIINFGSNLFIKEPV